MSENDHSQTLLNTATLLEHANQRQQASQLLLLAIVDKQPRSIVEVRHALQTCVNELKKVAKMEFYFDLGWLETPNTILDDFASLNWVEAHHSVPTYRSTRIGRAELLNQWKGLQPYLGMSLDAFQEMC